MKRVKEPKNEDIKFKLLLIDENLVRNNMMYKCLS